MHEGNESICAVCGDTAFVVHRAQLQCCRCGTGTNEFATTSPTLHLVDNPSRKRTVEAGGSMYKAWKMWFALRSESLLDSGVVVASVIMLVLLMAWVL
jgi:hypothetical protein